MSDEAAVGDDGEVPEGAFEDDLPEAPPAPMDGGLGDVLESAHELGHAAEDLAMAAGDATLDLPIDVGVVLDALAALIHRVPYKMGGKAHPLGMSIAHFLEDRGPVGIDCSGFVRWLLFLASGGAVNISDGTFNQRDFFRARADVLHLPSSPYAVCAQHDDVLRVAGFVKSNKVTFGHIWIVHNGLTGESHGKPSGGIDRRPWDHPHLVHTATWCYAIARLAPGG
jgi:hypothetical protein